MDLLRRPDLDPRGSRCSRIRRQRQREASRSKVSVRSLSKTSYAVFARAISRLRAFSDSQPDRVRTAATLGEMSHPRRTVGLWTADRTSTPSPTAHATAAGRSTRQDVDATTVRAANTAYQRRRREALQSEAIGDHSEASRDEWIAPVAGVVAAVALVWAVIRGAATA